VPDTKYNLIPNTALGDETVTLTEAKELVAQSGRMLLEERLAARTWGNISCRVDEDRIVITPSGLGYEAMRPEDVVSMSMSSGEWEGRLKPSSEKGVHIAAYRTLPDARFVIHTHQTYASAIGLTGMDDLALTEEERTALGGIEAAGYALPGTKRLADNIEKAFRKGAHVVLLVRHGVVIAASDREEAFRRARLLETVCRRACKGQPADEITHDEQMAKNLMASMSKAFKNVCHTGAAPVLACASAGKPIPAQLDDMAQMIGSRIMVAEAKEKAIQDALGKEAVVLVPGIGAICRGLTELDAKALCLLAEKACICWLHTQALEVNTKLSWFDTMLMHWIYLMKYSKAAGA